MIHVQSGSSTGCAGDRTGDLQPWAAKARDMDTTISGGDVVAQKEKLKAAGVEYLFGAYVDILGVPKSKCVPIDHLESMAPGSEVYTVGPLEGMGTWGPNEDECVVIPDLACLTVIAWDPR